MPRLLVAIGALLLASGCVNRSLIAPTDEGQTEAVHYFPQSLEKEIDILFVIDNSKSMNEEQVNLATNFPRLIEALRSPKLGPDGSGKPCHPDNPTGCRIPNVHVGVVSTDVGVGLVNGPYCSMNGDNGVLQSKPRGSCIPPSDSFIRYEEGVTNVEDPSTADPVERVKRGFSCIARLGTEGCGFEHPLEAARRALDGKTNPGFLRPDAYLALVFITDEDDCSGQTPQLFAEALDTEVDGFRCFQHGIRCDGPDLTQQGPHENCRPLDDPDPSKHLLRPVQSYVDFFRGLKPPGRVIVSVIAGPVEPVVVGYSDGPFVQPSCTSPGVAKPAIRLKAVVDAFGSRGDFSEICTTDFGPALKRLGQLIVASLGGQCISAPPLTEDGGLACQAGDDLGGVSCQTSCLDHADCVVELTTSERSGIVPRCEADRFTNATNTDCGARCPCWRVVSKPSDCKPEVNGSPYGLEILRRGEAEKGSAALVRCATSPLPWGSAELAAQPQCH